jgi:hypothetical protein
MWMEMDEELVDAMLESTEKMIGQRPQEVFVTEEPDEYGEFSDKEFTVRKEIRYMMIVKLNSVASKARNNIQRLIS